MRRDKRHHIENFRGQASFGRPSATEEYEMRALADLQKAMDLAFGLCEPDGRIRSFETFRDLYVFYTGDRGLTGVFDPRGLPDELRGVAAINSTTFPYAMANSLNRFLSIGYNKINYFEDVLISQQAPIKDLRPGSFIQLGFWQDLPVIDPEAEDYPDMADLEESKNDITPIQRGCVIPISRKVIVNDDIQLMAKLMERAGQVGRKTHARYVWGKWIDNATCADETAWFTSGHGNLGSGAMSISTVTAAVTALANMTEQGPSTDKLGLDLSNFKWHLIAPVGMWTDAISINQMKSYYSSNDLTSKTINPCCNLFGARNERIATPPFLSDANDWGVVRSPAEVPIIEMQYVDGNVEPAIDLFIDPYADTAIKADWFGLKVNHEYAGEVMDYRGGYKAVVT